jgi:hypothetical protein
MKSPIAFLLLITIIFSCESREEKTTQTVEPVSFDQVRTAFFNNIRTAPEAAAQIQATAAEFNATLLNDPGKAQSYIRDTVKSAANLGIYLADLNYCVAYQQSNYTAELFTATNTLSTVIGIEQDVLDFLFNRFHDNIENNDSVKSVLNDLYWKSTTALQGTERERLVGMAMAAFQIENLHLALGVIKNYPKDMLPDDARTKILIPIFRMVLGQQKNVETIHGFVRASIDPSAREKYPNYTYIDNAFSELIAVYKRLNVEEAIANNQGTALMNDAVVNELSEMVSVIREKVVSI